VCGWLGGRASPSSFLAHPGTWGRVLASSCDTGMYFHALFPTYRYIGRAHALQRSHYLTLPRYTHLTYSCPTPSIFACNQKLETAQEHAPGSEWVSRRPGRGIRSASPQCPLSAASKPALHPAPAFFLRTTTIPHPQAASSPTPRNSSVYYGVILSFAVRPLGAPASMQASTLSFLLQSSLHLQPSDTTQDEVGGKPLL
jgi:hypothetical protein